MCQAFFIVFLHHFAYFLFESVAVVKLVCKEFKACGSRRQYDLVAFFKAVFQLRQKRVEAVEGTVIRDAACIKAL